MTYTEEVQHNCDISDARDHGIYTMCTMVLKLRNLYKWERGLEPWQEAEPADLLDWIDTKEQYWETIANEQFSTITLDKQQHDPHSLEEINTIIGGDNLYYGSGYGRSMKPVFFLAEKEKDYTVAGLPVLVLGKEWAREMSSPFAMAQEGHIIIRRESLRYFLYDQIQELQGSCRASFRHALEKYGLVDNGKLNQMGLRKKLDAIVSEEMDLFIYHEVGEILQEQLDSETLTKISMLYPNSVIELVSRTIKDVLADTHENGLLAYCIREQKETSLSFYIGFLDGLRKNLLPEIQPAWEKFLLTSDWQIIEDARLHSLQENGKIAEKISSIMKQVESISEKQIEDMFNREIITPLGLNVQNRES